MGSWRQRDLQLRVFVVVVWATLAVPFAQARARHSDAWAREHFATAERMREALNGRPPAERTRREYQRVLNAYRLVYFGMPTSAKADPSVVAVAETLVEMGRRFEDDKILHAAIDEYKFLRREYPGSKYRCEALFTIGEIYQDDLNDPDSARAAFKEFLRHYPHNHLAGDAREAIAALGQPARKSSGNARSAELKSSPRRNDDREVLAENNGSKEKPPRSEVIERTDESASGQASPREGDAPAGDSPQTRSGRLPRVTSIRHWSTPDYTRVAIDLESNVDFSSERIARPARIYFDLHDTRLASTLVGKTFDVDDGFLKKVRVAQFAPRRTRIVLEVDNLADYDAFLLPNPSRLIIDIHGKNAHAKLSGHTFRAEADITSPAKAGEEDSDEGGAASTATLATAEKSLSEKSEVVNTSADRSGGAVPAGPSALKPQTTIVKRVVEADYDEDDSAPQATARSAPETRSVESRKSDPDDTDAEISDFATREAKPTLSGDRSLIRALGLKIGKIVIDPGHGGHDTGTIGPDGLEEKNLVLDVGRRLGKLLETRLGAEVVYTRKDDTFIPLETRTAIANQARADLFVSIHANSSHDPEARGVETYYLNFTSSPEALEVAARENAVSEKSIYELQDLVKKIALKEKIEESREFAGDVQESLHSGLAAKAPAVRDRGVKKAPFIVLIGANMPSILAEISFVSNPTDERHLSTGEYRQRIAESLYHGIAKYVHGLSGIKIASKMDKAAVQ